MSKYSAILLTVYGQAMIAQSASEKKPLIFTKVELGDGALVENEVFIEFTRLKNPLLSMNVNSIKNEGNATCTILATVDNSQVEQGFFARELGVFAKVGNDGEEQLFAYTNAGNYADYTPDKNSTLDEKQVAINLAVGNASSITAIIGSAQYATLENLQSHNDSADSHPDIRQKITDDIDAHNSIAAAHPAMDFVKSLSSADDGLHYTMRNESEDRVIDIVSVGDVAFRYKLAPGWVKANGATVKRSDYPKLVQFATDNDLFTSSPTSNPQLFGQGDGNTTFILPDLRNRFIEGGDTIGVKSAGLPNITGTTKLNGGPWYTANMDSGALYQEAIHSSDSSGRNSNGLSINFDASRSNSIYGASDTVQPPAVVLIPQIKY